MALPAEAEMLLDELRRGVLDSELREIAMLIESGIQGEDLRYMQILETRILEAYHREGVLGYLERQWICEEIAQIHVKS